MYGGGQGVRFPYFLLKVCKTGVLSPERKSAKHMIKVKVLKRHIEKAKRLRAKEVFESYEYNWNPCNCPIALAIKEKTHKKVKVERPESIYINSKPYKATCHNNQVNLLSFINHFDKGYHYLLSSNFTVILKTEKELCNA